jgi:hypothetical protein
MQSQSNRLMIAWLLTLGMMISVGGIVVSTSTLRAADPAPSAPTKLADLTSITNQLPSLRSKNAVVGSFEFDDDDVMIRGNGTMHPPQGVIPPKVQVNSIKTPKQSACIRIDLNHDQAKSLLGAIAGSVTAASPVTLEDDKHNSYPPIGWIIQSGDDLKVSVDPAAPIGTVADIPVAKMRDEDKMFVYFHVNRNVKILNFKIGTTKTLPINLKVPK